MSAPVSMAQIVPFVLFCSSVVFGYTVPIVRHENSAEALEKARTFVSRLNLTEKIDMITGIQGVDAGGCIGNIKAIPRLNFSGICMQDGPQAMNRADLVSVFASGVLVGATWDVDLMFERGKAMGEEFRGKGAHVQLGPVAGPLGRHALGGRNWEGFSPDPYLAGKAMQATVHGVQSVGAQACSKHFVGNEQETQRTNSFSNGTEILGISSNIDDRTLHELYVWPFADAIRAGSASIMCSYNRVNQTYACEDRRLLDEILKKELGFQGYVVSDWFAVHSGAKSINAGLDMNMPGGLDIDSVQMGLPLSYWGSTNVTRMINDGSVSESRIDEMIQRIMFPYYQLHQDEDYPTVDPSLVLSLAAQQGIQLDSALVPNVPSRNVQGNHSAIIRRIGADGVVLLKNTNNTLPLMSPRNIGVFGNDAAPPTDGVVYENSFRFEIGTLDIGGGSGTGRPTYLVSPFEALMAKAKVLNARLQYVTNNRVLAENNFKSIYPVPEVCLVFLNTFASEGWDRTTYEADWNSTLVVENVARFCPNTVVVTHSAGVNTFPWANHPNVTAILAAHLPGQESGNSIVDVLWGAINPSAKLPYSIPANQSDYDIPIVNLTDGEVTSPEAWQADFSEGQLIDYRHFDHYNITPLFEFGFGLSYTTFALEGPLRLERLAKNVTAAPDSVAEVLPGGNSDLWVPLLRVTAHVKNSGAVAGATVPQLYLSSPPETTPAGTPSQVLRGFNKIYLEPGESRQVTFDLLRRDLSYWDVAMQTWLLPAGSFTLRVGFSSRDIRDTISVALMD